MVQGRDERLLHYGDRGTVTLDIHAVEKSQQLLAHGSDNGARPVLELEGLPEPQGLSVDEEGVIPVVVGNPEIIPDGKDLFPYQIAHTAHSATRRGMPGSYAQEALVAATGKEKL